MTLEEFAAMTRRIIARDGIVGFLPTACYPQRRHISVLAGLPPQADVEVETLTWAIRNAQPDEEILIAFSISADRFKIIRRSSEATEQGVFAVA